MATDQMQAKPASVPKYEAVVEQQLGRAIGRVRFLDVTAALLGLAAATLLYALVVIALDRWLVLSTVARQAALILYLAAACTYLGVFVVWPLCQRVNPYFAAKQLEQTLPEAKNSVVNWLDLKHQELPGAIRAAVGQRAAQEVRRANLDEAISGRRAAWAGGAAGVLFVALLITLAVLGPSQFWSLFGRAFSPFSAGGILTRTHIELMQPQGDAVVPADQPVAFAASIGGKVPGRNRPDSPRLLFRYRQTDPYEERPLEHERDSEWVTNLPASQVFSGFWYKITAGDAETDEFQVRVRSTPMVERFDVGFHYRPYVGWPDKISQEPILKELRGTEVTLVAHTNRAVKAGTCTIESKSGPQAVPGERVVGDDAALRFKFTIERDGQYRISFTSVEGETNPDPLPYAITALNDFPPTVLLTKPGEDMTLPANGLLTLEGSASDDLGVEQMTLRMQVNGQPLQPKPYRPGKLFKMSDGGYPKMLTYKEAIELDKLKDEQGQPFPLQPKMVLEYWLEAKDACDYPKPNISESQHYKVTIADPDKDQNKQQKERDQAKNEQQKHEEQQDQQLAKENEKRQQENKGGRGQDQPKNDGDKNQDQQSGQQGNDEQPDPQAQEAQKKLEDAFKNKDNEQKSDAKPPDNDNKSAEQKDNPTGNQDQPQPGQAKSSDNKTDQGGPGQDARQEPGQDKDGGAKGDAQKGEDKKDGQSGKGEQQNGAKDGSDTGQPNPNGKTEGGGPQQDGTKPDKGTAKSSAQQTQDKPNAKQPAPSESKDNNQGDTSGAQPKGDPGKASQGTPDKAEPKTEGAKTDGPASPKPGEQKDEKKDGQGGGTAGPRKEKPDKPREGTGSSAEKKDQSSKPKTGTQPNAGQGDEKPGEKATPKDVAKLAEQMNKEQGEKQEEIAKQLAQVAQNAKDEKAREEAAKALQQGGRDPQTGEPNAAAPKPGPQSTSQKQQAGKKPAEARRPPEKEGPQAGDAKSKEGHTGGPNSDGKNGDNKQGKDQPTDGQGPAKPTAGAKGTREGNTEPGGGASGQTGQRRDDEPPDLHGGPLDPRDRRKKGELLLERFNKLLEKDKKKFLEDAKLSEEDLKRLRDDIARRKTQRAENPEVAPRATGPGSRDNRGAARVKQEGKSRAADTQYGGPGTPPPDLRDIFREFTSGGQKKE